MTRQIIELNLLLAMNATELRKENERLKAALAQSQSKFDQATAQHEAVSQQFTATLAEKDRQLSSLEHQLKILLQQIRGSRQERIDPDQLLLFSADELKEIADQLSQQNADDELLDDDSNGPKRKKRRKSSGRVGKLPDHLQREVIRHELSPEEQACPCCGELRAEIGIESSEQLELVPARLKVLEHHRVKYACRTCAEHVAIADKPPQPIEKRAAGAWAMRAHGAQQVRRSPANVPSRRHSLTLGQDDSP